MGNQYLDFKTKVLLTLIHPALRKVQGLMPTSPDDRAKLKKSISQDGIRDPLKVIYDKEGEPYLISGWTRLQIASELSIDKVPILAVNPPDPESYAISENLDRRQMTLDQKRKLAEYLFEKNPSKSDRQVAKETGIDHKTVGKIREKPRGEFPHVSQTKGESITKPQKKDSLGRAIPEKKKPILKAVEIRSKIADLRKKKAQIETEIKKLEAQLKKKVG